MPTFKRKNLEVVNSADNKSNKDWWENNPMCYSWDLKNQWNSEIPDLNKINSDFSWQFEGEMYDGQLMKWNFTKCYQLLMYYRIE